MVSESTNKQIKQTMSGEQYIAFKTDGLGRRPQSKFMRRVYEAMLTAENVTVTIYADYSRELFTN